VPQATDFPWFPAVAEEIVIFFFPLDILSTAYAPPKCLKGF